MPRAFVILRPTGSLFPTGEFVPETDDWYTWYPQGRDNGFTFLHARMMATASNNAALFVFAPTPALAARLTTFASASSRAWTLPELRADNGVAATQIKARWKDTFSGSFTLLGDMAGHSYPGIKEGND